MKQKKLLLSIICVLSLALYACANSAYTTNSTKNLQTISDDLTAKTASPKSESVSTTEKSMEKTSTEKPSNDIVESTTLIFDMPEDFIESEENCYCPEDFTKGSNINFLELPNDGSFNELNADILLASIEPQLESVYGIDLTVTLIDEEFYNIDDYQAFRYILEYKIGDETITQLQCIIDTPATLQFLTYSAINSEGYLDAFIASMQSLRYE